MYTFCLVATISLTNVFCLNALLQFALRWCTLRVQCDALVYSKVFGFELPWFALIYVGELAWLALRCVASLHVLHCFLDLRACGSRGSRGSIEQSAALL